MERNKRKFKVTIEGVTYEVEVEEIMEGGQSEAPPLATSESSSTPAVKPPPAVVPGLEVISSPMPGTVISVRVRAGDVVKTGDVLLVLESMKIQTDIVAPSDGRIKEVYVQEGQYVRAKDRLISISVG